MKTLTELYDSIVSKIADINTAIKDKDAMKRDKLFYELDELEKDYAHTKKLQEYDKFVACDFPVKELILKEQYTVLGHKTERSKETHIITRCKLDEKAKKKFDLLDFCKAKSEEGKLSDHWALSLEKLSLICALKWTLEETSGAEQAAQLKKLRDCYYIDEAARTVEFLKNAGDKDIEGVAVPTSMTSMTKLLQSIVDETLFMPNKKGKNMLKVTGHQVKQFMNLFTKRGKKWGSLSAAQGREFRENFYSMMRCVIEGRGFALEYEGAKNSDDEDTETTDKQEATNTQDSDKSKDVSTVTETTDEQE